METPQSVELSVSNADADLANQSNEQLLQRLAQSVESRRRHRNKQKIVYAVYYVVCGIGGILLAFAPLFHFITPSSSLGVQISFLLFVVVFMTFINRFNQQYYRRTAQQRDPVIDELARRGEERALGPLLEMMDMRMSVSSKNWGASRDVFIESLRLLLARLTPESFAELSDAQIHQLSPLLLLPEPALRASISATLCRSGDARALRSLRKYESLYRLQRIQKFNPALSMMKAWLRRRKMPVLEEESFELVKRCCEAIEPRVEAEKRMSQLLRASDGGTEQPANQLLRGAMPATASEPVEQLLHPATTTFADAQELETAESGAASHAVPPVGTTLYTQTPAAEVEEVNITRG